MGSLSARRAWIEIGAPTTQAGKHAVALRKESVDRNAFGLSYFYIIKIVALRKESVDRNLASWSAVLTELVALRKESVDRNDAECLRR